MMGQISRWARAGAMAVFCAGMVGGCCSFPPHPVDDRSRLTEASMPQLQAAASTEATPLKVSVAEASEVVKQYQARFHWLWLDDGYLPTADSTEAVLWDQLHVQIFTAKKSAYLLRGKQVILEIHPAPRQWGVADVMDDGRPGLVWMSAPSDFHAAPTFGAWSPGVGIASIGFEWGAYSRLPALVAVPGDLPAVYSYMWEGTPWKIACLQMTKPAGQKKPSLIRLDTQDGLMHRDSSRIYLNWAS